MTFFSKHFEAMIVLLFGFIMTTIVSDTIYEHSVFNAKREFRTIALSKLIRIGQYFSYIDKFINTFSEHEEKLKQTEGSFTSFIEFAENAKKYLKFGDWLWLVSFNGGSVQDFERELLEKVPQYKNVFIKNDINTKLKFPIKYVYPFNKIYEYIGQDFSCYKNIEKVIEYAIKFCYESYSFAVLKKRQNYYTNMIVFKPIVDRNNKLLGLLAFDFIINKFIRLIMNNYPHDGIALNLYDIEDMNNYDACLFSSETIENKRFKGNNIDDRYEIYFPLFFLGQSLCVQTYPNSEYKLFANADIVLKVSLFSGFAFTIFFAILSMYLISQKKITEYEVENRMIRAKDEIDALKKSNLILMDIMEKSKQLALNSASANVSKSLFFANLSHELRTPLNGIAAMSEMLLDSEINDEQKKYAEIIKTSSDNLLNLINDILDLAKINSGKMTYEVIDFNLKELLLNTCDLFKLKTDLKGIYIKLDFDSNAPEMVSGDPTRLRQVVSNLVSNAVKFTSSGGVTVKCLCESASATEAKFYFEVCDTGIGIASENISDLFNAYTQAEKTTSRKYGGTGLGLAISQKIVMHFGGKIFVDSHVNKGSKFYFAINLKRQRKGSIHKNIEALKKL